MVARRNLSRLTSGRILAAAFVVLTGCGGLSERESNDSHAGSGGSSVSSGSGGTSGATGATGATGGSSGTAGTAGTGGCGGYCPPGSCVYEGEGHWNGTSFPSSDGCSTCYCNEGVVGCTLTDCPPEEPCDAFLEVYPVALAQAKRCVPGLPSSCDILTASGLECACPTFVDDSSEVDAIISRWNDYGCGRGPGVTCGACPPDPLSAYCSADGVCVESYRE